MPVVLRFSTASSPTAHGVNSTTGRLSLFAGTGGSNRFVGIPDLVIRNPKTDRVLLVDAERDTVISF